MPTWKTIPHSGTYGEPIALPDDLVRPGPGRATVAGQRDSGETRRLPIGTAGGWHTIVVSRKASAMIFWRETFMDGASGAGSTARKTLVNTTRLMPFSLVDA
ncbi:hypothetical protein GCM10023334_081450 [Nonomuraea thailandensis]